MSERTVELVVTGCESGCPFYVADWTSCHHPDIDGDDVQAEFILEMERRGLDPFAEAPKWRPTWCPLRSGPVVVRAAPGGS